MLHHLLLLLLVASAATLQLPLSPAQRQVRRLLGKERELAKSQDMLRNVLAERVEVDRQQVQQQAITELIKSTLGLDRGSAASAEDAARVEASVNELEAVSPCILAGPALIDALAGSSWRLVYASALVRDSGTPERSSVRALGPRSMAELLAATSPMSLGSVTQSFSAARLKDTVSLALPLPWPLPRRTLAATFEQALDATGAPGGLTARLERVGLCRGGEEFLLGPSFLRRAELPVPRELLGRFPPAQELGLTCSVALLDGPTRISVLRSSLGDVRVFAATAESLVGPEEPAAPTAAAAAAAYLEDCRQGTSVGALVGRVVLTDRVEAPLARAGAADADRPALADEEETYDEEFWVDGVGYTSDGSEPEFSI